ncbi:MAG: hypothetical protein KatS3mg077_0811 [Candidatus Binatia bacterium]|nr:MAG: hypothetical protein KatS3mg077_0811 [Candidatus Binatia bacterium]
MKRAWVSGAVVLGVVLSYCEAAEGTREKLLLPHVDTVGLSVRGFVRNEGQWVNRAAFVAPGFPRSTWVTRNGELRHVVAVGETECLNVPEGLPASTVRPPFVPKSCPRKTWVISERFVGGKATRVVGEGPVQGRVGYFVGANAAKHRNGLPVYSEVSLGDIWPGVQVRLKVSEQGVEKYFHVAPGKPLEAIQVEVAGADRLGVAPDGGLRIESRHGEATLSRPRAWQEGNDDVVPVRVRYRVIGHNRYGFVGEDVDPTRPLVIDPVLQSTYAGGSAWERVQALAVHPGNGDVYVAGWTHSLEFPEPGRAPGSIVGGWTDAFVARFSADLTTLRQWIIFGGTDFDEALSLAIDPASGEIFVGGQTNSADFPDGATGAQGSFGGMRDGFVVALDPDLGRLRATFFGGGDYDGVTAVALHPTNGDVYLTGWTKSPNLPGTAGSAQPALAGQTEVFVARLSRSLASIQRATYLGGSNGDGPGGLVIHPTTGDVYVGGSTYSGDFPGTTGGTQVARRGDVDGFVARLNPALTELLQATYLGGTQNDAIGRLALSPLNGGVYVVGTTESPDLPGTLGGAQQAIAGFYDGFVARLDASLTSLEQATYIGGWNMELARVLAVHAGTGEVYVGGDTSSDDFPGTSGGLQAVLTGGEDMFLARFSPSLTTLLQATYLGGTRFESPTYLLVEPAGNELYVGGWTSSRDFPGAAGGAREVKLGGIQEWDGVVARLPVDLATDVSCAPSPTSGCMAGSHGELRIDDRSNSALDKVAWKFAPGSGLSPGAFGNPVSGSTAYALCVYDGAALVMEAPLTLSPGRWKRTANGYQYRDPSARNEGYRHVALQGGSTGGAGAAVRLVGPFLRLPAPASSSQFFTAAGGVTVQLQQSGGACYETVFSPGSIRKNSAARFLARY